MPVNACGVTASASFDPEPYERDPDPVPEAPPVDQPPFLRFDHGTTRDASGQLEAHAAVLHGHDPATGLDLAVLSFAAEAGPRGARAGVIAERIGLSNPDATRDIHVDILSAGAELSSKNPDGSHGIALSAHAVLLDIEATFPFGHANSLTLGAALGAGIHLGAGLRDVDHDGKRELCVRATEIVTVGACIEVPW